MGRTLAGSDRSSTTTTTAVVICEGTTQSKRQNGVTLAVLSAVIVGWLVGKLLHCLEVCTRYKGYSPSAVPAQLWRRSAESSYGTGGETGVCPAHSCCCAMCLAMPAKSVRQHTRQNTCGKHPHLSVCQEGVAALRELC